MASKLPAQKNAWKQSAKDYNIHPLQLLTDGDTMASASKFEFDHFLRLRILYTQNVRPKDLAASDGFPTEDVKKMKKLLDNDPHGSFLRRFLRNPDDLKKHWNLNSFDQSGKFAIPLEHLHLIAKRNFKGLGEDEDLSETKIVWSPPKVRAVVPLHAVDRSRQPETPSKPSSHPSRLRPQEPKMYDESLNPFDNDLGISDLSINYPQEEQSPSGSDLERAKDSYDRSEFSRGDEQTVNAALVDLMIALSALLGYTGRIHHDRAKFVVPKDAETHLYSAAVDGLIMHVHDEKVNGFMEVKGDLRGRSQPVRRQIGAQMAAFIYDQEIKISEDKAGREIKTAYKGKGKQAKGKGSKGKEVEDLQRKNSQKWMVSLDGYFAFVNIATYDQTYLDFLSGTPPSGPNDAFMHMKEYGPFDLRIWSAKGDDIGLEVFLQDVGALMLRGLDS